jgi:hypothetical protein
LKASRSRRPAPPSSKGSVALPKRNYGFEKRQKELNKQRKQEEKRQRKLERSSAPPAEGEAEETDPLAPKPED